VVELEERRWDMSKDSRGGKSRKVVRAKRRRKAKAAGRITRGPATAQERVSTWDTVKGRS